MNIILQFIGTAAVLVVQGSKDPFIKYFFTSVVIVVFGIISLINRKK